MIFSRQVREHLEALVPERPAALQKMEAHAEEQNFPIIGRARGHRCYHIARMTGARRIFAPADRSPMTDGVREFTRLITRSPKWIVSLVQIRDSLIIATRL